MCRLLAVQDSSPFDIAGHLRQLAEIAKHSCEYQGDGWGCAWQENNRWRIYRNIRPIWDDELNRFGRTTVLLAHARSAFRNDSLEVENNMPFIIDPAVFIFNGELRGVKIQASGRIGAEKLFHFLHRFAGPNPHTGLTKALEIVRRRTRHIRAMNFILADDQALIIHAYFNEAPGYFTLYKKSVGTLFMVSSEPYRDEACWVPLPNEYLEVHSYSS